MRKYPEENWKALGQWVHDARLQAGMRDAEEWAKRVGRSTRQLRGLERGEPVGAETIELVAEALLVAEWRLFAILIDPESAESGVAIAREHEFRRAYESETGRSATGPGPEDGSVTVAEASNDALIFELQRRLSRLDELLHPGDVWHRPERPTRDTERQENGHEPPTTQAGASPDIAWVPPDPEVEERPYAAHPMKGRQSLGRQLRKQQDDEGEMP